MWKCNECKIEFEKPDVALMYEDGFLVGASPYCPNVECGSDDIDELKTCEMCHETYITSEKDRCPTCEETTALWLEEAIGNIQSDTGAERSEVLRALGDWIEKF